MTDSDQLLHQKPTRDHYRTFIGAQYLLHLAVQTRTRRMLEQAPQLNLLDWPDCTRIKALENDLDALDVSVEPPDGNAIVFDTHGALLGLVYVCEGSCIGNQRLYSALNKHENFRYWNSAEFLVSCKVGFAQRWKSVIDSVDQISTSGSPLDGSGYDDIEKGALDGFQLFANGWLALTGRVAARDNSAPSHAETST